MNIGSHNSFSYLPPRKWWMYLLRFAAKCQDKNIYEQYIKYDVKCFDIRVRFKDDKIILAHGLIEYREYDLDKFFNYINIMRDCYIRIILEYNKLPKDYKLQEFLFQLWCKLIESKYQNIKFFGGNRKWDWKQIYKFKNQDPALDDKYSSMTHPYLIDDWFPRLYAIFNNKKNIKNKTDKDFLFIDFVNIK